MTGKTNGALAVDLQPSSPAKAGDPADVGWAKAHVRRAHHDTVNADGGHASLLPTLHLLLPHCEERTRHRIASLTLAMTAIRI
jgi:hypothetical protein